MYAYLACYGPATFLATSVCPHCKFISSFFLTFVFSSGAAFFIPSIFYVWKNMKVSKLPQLEIFCL